MMRESPMGNLNVRTLIKLINGTCLKSEPIAPTPPDRVKDFLDGRHAIKWVSI